jgi:hypothetical protein
MSTRGGKRLASSPVGASFKDPRREGIQQQSGRFDALGDYESDGGEWTTVTNERSRPQTDTSAPASTTGTQQPSFAEVTAQNTSQGNSQDTRQTGGAKKTLERMFRTAPPDGPHRDLIIVEIRQVNGVPFKGSLHYKEAKYGIFEHCLKQDPTSIHGLNFAFSDYPIVKYKLKHQINIDDLKPLEFFEYHRSYKVNGHEKTDVLQCKIKGIRSDYSGENDLMDEDQDQNIRWVKIEWCDWAFEEHQILAWLEQFGEPIGHVTEELYPDSDSEGDPTGNGTYTVKMKLHSPIPQLLPMWGKRIRIYYRGVQKLCPRCFGNHPRKNCKSEKRRWVDYVLDFMGQYQDIPDEIYGRWYQVINEEFGEVVKPQDQNITNQPEEREPSETDKQTQQAEQAQSSTRQQTSVIQKKMAFVSNRNRTQRNPPTPAENTAHHSTITREEEISLADFLAVGLSLTEARSMKENEDKLAAIKFKARELKRQRESGAILSRGAKSTTRFGPGSTLGRRGGTSFN